MNHTSYTLVAQEACADLEIRILGLEDKGYPVEITFSGEQEFPRGFLKPDVLPWIPSASPAADGERLFNLLFSDDELKKAWANVQGQQTARSRWYEGQQTARSGWYEGHPPRRRIRLRIDHAAPELHAIPWELLRDASPGAPPRHLAADAETPFSRYLAGQWRPGRPVLHRPIKLLVAIANPENLGDYHLDALDVEAERQVIEGAVADLDAEQLEITFLEPPATLEALEAELKKGYHILHLVAHGRFGGRQETPVLYLAKEGNYVRGVTDEAFAEMLARQGESLRLVFLASCQSAVRDSAHAFRGFAPRLIAAGVPAVLAMQESVPVETAREFAGTFYRQLLQHGYVDLASNEARSALLTAGLPGASIPALYMRLRSGMLFGQRGRILGDRVESFWSILLENIADGECTPFLGPGVTKKLTPSPAELAQALARDHNYPFTECDNLPRVAQFVGTFDDRRLRKDVVNALTTGFKKRTGLKPDPRDRRLGLSRTIAAAEWSRLSQDLCEAEIHHQLADLDLPLYVTTNFDNFMTLALQARGRHPRRETIAWREGLQTEAANPYYDLDPPVDPEAPPVVLHLFGTDEDLLSMVLTEDDYLDYLRRISRDYQYLVPTSVNAALASTTLLFLGYRLEDLDFKVVMRGLLANVDLERQKRLHVAVQIEAAQVDKAAHEEIMRYFQKYFSNSRIDLYWGSAHQFVSDLHARWQEYIHG